jgi:threonine dehydratase
LADDELVGLASDLDELIAAVDGVGFTSTPLERADELSSALNFVSHGGVWIKDETGDVAGSQKARHLFSILLHLFVAERLRLVPWSSENERPNLAIASCGNAAIAASTLARAVEWPIEVFIPEWADGAVVDTLSELGAQITRCRRSDSGSPGDPTLIRFRSAVNQGAIPFSVQGPENALCLDGGRSIGWEMAEQLRTTGISSLDAVFVQVGGGAFAASVSRGLSEAGCPAPFYAVQTAGCAPLARAWSSAQFDERAASQWTLHMWPWESEPRSLADGILDDETYDWVADIDQLRRTLGAVVVVDENEVRAAAEIGPSLTGIDASPTGTAGLAGLLHSRGQFDDAARVAVIFSGIRRD